MPTQAELASYCASGKNCLTCKYPDCIYERSTLQDFRTSHQIDIAARISEKDHRGQKLAAQQRAYYEANKEKWKTVYAENRRKKIVENS